MVSCSAKAPRVIYGGIHYTNTNTQPRIKFRGIVVSAKTTKLITPRNFLRLRYIQVIPRQVSKTGQLYHLQTRDMVKYVGYTTVRSFDLRCQKWYIYVAILQDIIKWILLTIGFVVVFIITEEITSDEDYTGSVITTLLVSC